MAAKKWTDEQQQAALDLHRQHGPAEAARRTGIPKGTIASWARRNGVQTDALANTQQATQVASVKWAERRLTIADDLGDAVAVFVQAAREAAVKGDGRNAQALATAAAISLDKAQLVSGGPTGRVEHDVTDPAKRLALVKDLKAKPDQAAS